MVKKYRKSLFIFRRDLRLEDNTGLIFALNNSQTVIPAFIFTVEQIDDNTYKSNRCLTFMIESLQDLREQLQQKGGNLYLFQGKPEEVVHRCISNINIEAVIVNKDYTPFSTDRDKKIATICEANNISFYSFDDALLHPPEDTLKANGRPYTVFTPYFRNTLKREIQPPAENSNNNYFQKQIPFSQNPALLKKLLPLIKTPSPLHGGRTEALKILNNLGTLEKYDTYRNYPALDYSTHLSPYLKFTVCSPREVYASICRHLHSQHELIRSLHWRDFFTGIAYFFPYVFGGAFHPKFDKLKWSYDKHSFERWCEGSTGFPIVDAGMRQLNETGLMHNRVRMITASFLIKDLLIDWRWGEKYFAQNLIDYDPSVNNGNWQWVASTGCDCQPYFRIFNPWLQQKKFDPDCVYIKKWIPQLREIPPAAIHRWNNKQLHGTKYPAPMVDHDIEAKKTISAYKSVYTEDH